MRKFQTLRIKFQKMDKDNGKPFDPDQSSGEYRENLFNQAQKLWAKLHDFNDGYTLDMLMEDLDAYFDGEVDFDFEKIKNMVCRNNKLNEIVKRAKLLNTHPVSEIIKEILKESSQN